jgi:hypothetical protein
MKAIDMKKIYQDYKGQWVALAGPRSNKVVAFGKDLKKVVEEAKKKGVKMPVMAQIPKKVMPIVGGYSLSK